MSHHKITESVWTLFKYILDPQSKLTIRNIREENKNNQQCYV